MAMLVREPGKVLIVTEPLAGATNWNQTSPPVSGAPQLGAAGRVVMAPERLVALSVLKEVGEQGEPTLRRAAPQGLSFGGGIGS